MSDLSRGARRRRDVLVGGSSAVLAVLATLAVQARIGHPAAPVPATRESMVHAMGHEVMPFDLNRTKHVFQMTTSGGVQDVVTRTPGDSSQIPLIRQHLQHEAMRFAAGEFTDPMTLHGPDMPGLKELAAGAAAVQVQYASLPDGGRITFATTEPALITAIHRWFGAQLSDHGADATYR